MKNDQKNLCVFAHFSNDLHLPHYVQIYLNELALYFDQIIFVTNLNPRREISFDSEKPIEVMQVKNEGYDLGMFYKAFKAIKLEEYSQIACINDSNILFNKLNRIFEWSKNNEFDFWGLIDSHEKPWFSKHSENYHIQSHFIVFNREAIRKLPEFFKTIDFEAIFGKEDISEVRKMVIDTWEIGLSRYLISEGLKYGSYIDSQLLSDEYSSGKAINVTHKLYTELIKSGYPLIKKRIIAQNKWTDTLKNVLPWEDMIRKYGNQNWEIDELIKELNKIRDDAANPTLVKIRKLLVNTFNSFIRKEVA